jgi:hypothetical protein
MVQTIQASALNLLDVKERFNLSEVRNPDFFPEWQVELPEITEAEKQWLDQIQEDFLGIAQQPLHEEIVKLSVLAPLLFLAGFTRLPFKPEAEKPVEIAFENEDEIIRGKIDILLLHQRLWALVVEAKRQQLNVSLALPQALFHMMSSPNGELPTYGFAVNGSEFLFIKLVKQEPPQYGLSRLFSLINPGNDLYTVLAVLKHLREIILS